MSRLILGFMAFAGCLSAASILDQSTIVGDGSNSSYSNQVFGPDYPEYSGYVVDDLTLTVNTTLDTVTIYVQSPYADLTQIDGLTGVFNVFAVNGASPGAGDDPTAGTIESLSAVRLSPDGNDYSLTASGLNLSLTAGSYWIGLTPVVDYSSYSGVYLWSTAGAVNGSPAWYLNPGNGFAGGTSWLDLSVVDAGFGDAAILVTGDETVPEPGAMLTVGGALLVFGLLRRRKK